VCVRARVCIYIYKLKVKKDSFLHIHTITIYIMALCVKKSFLNIFIMYYIKAQLLHPLQCEVSF